MLGRNQKYLGCALESFKRIFFEDIFRSQASIEELCRAKGFWGRESNEVSFKGKITSEIC
jgi:hypothetical protein